MKVYLDNNIFIYLENETLTIEDIENLIGNKIDKIFFSASHIQETLEIKGEDIIQIQERINKRLNTIEKFTNNNYINKNLNNEVFEFTESPFEVIKTVTEVSFAQNAMKNLANFISEEQKIETRRLLNINPEEINNYTPQEVIAHLSQKLTSNNQEYNFLDMVELCISYHPDGNKFDISHRVGATFELLDMLGYWKDKYNDKSNYARLWDSSHCYYASYCDYFISNDKRTVNKSKVVYDIYSINTKILMPKII